MTDTPAPEPLLAASRLLGADLLFLQLVEYLVEKREAQRRASQPGVRVQLGALHEQFQRRCAAIFEQRLGRERAPAVLAALESAALQRYLAARHTMAPALRQQLGELQQRMGNLKL